MTSGETAIISRATASILTSRGRGAVATIRVHDATNLDRRALQLPFASTSGLSLVSEPFGRVLFGKWGLESAEEIVVCRLDQATIDIHCHGGDAALGRIVADLESLGIECVPWHDQESALRGALAAECLDALSRAPTLRTAAIVLEQQSGTLRSAFTALAAPAEGRPGKCGDRCRLVDELLARASFGLHLTEPWRVVVSGRPNVGKSSLVNALVGFTRAIVFDQPGTTRDVVTVETAFEGWPVTLVDTAGLRSATDSIEAAGISRAKEQLVKADCRIVVCDISQPPEQVDFELLREWPDSLIVANKVDRPDAWGAAIPVGAVRVSSVSGEGIDDLARSIASFLVPHPPEASAAVPLTRRQVELLSAIRAALDRADELAFEQNFAELLR